MNNSLKDKYPDLCKEWDYSKNGDLKPKDVYSSSSQLVWWICNKGHSFEARVVNRKNGSGCHYCAHQKVEVATSLATLFPHLVEEWDYLKNSPLKPEEVFPTAQRKVWWVCKKHGSYLCSCANKTKKKGCPFCSHNKVHLDTCLSSLFPELVKYWGKDNVISPLELAPYSRKKVWWVCDQGHEYLSSVCDRTSSFTQGYLGCPYCAGRKVSTSNNLLYLFPKEASEWDYSKNINSPSEITAKSSKKVWWICAKGHSWLAKIANRTSIKNGCPVCSVSKRETEVRSVFEKILNTSFPKSKPPWLVNPETKKQLELDGFNSDLNLAFEYDGEWHYLPALKNSNHIDELIKQKKRDAIKDILCKQNQIVLVRVPYTTQDLEQYITQRLIEEKYVNSSFKALVSNF